jgi:hypothetical protein
MKIANTYEVALAAIALMIAATCSKAKANLFDSTAKTEQKLGQASIVLGNCRQYFYGNWRVDCYFDSEGTCQSAGYTKLDGTAISKEQADQLDAANLPASVLLGEGWIDEHWGESPTLRAKSWTYSKGSLLLFQVVSGWWRSDTTSGWQYQRNYSTRKGNDLVKQWTKDMEKVIEPSRKPNNPMPI